MLAYSEEFKSHAENYFGSPAQEQVWDKEFVAQKTPGLKCLEFQPSDELGYFSYVSCGLASLLPDEEVKHEYVISSPFMTPEHSELMLMIGAALINRKAFYGLGDIIKIGRPWIYGSEAEHLLVSLPYPYGPNLEIANSVLSDLRVLWLLPIYTSEVKYYESQGLDALEEKFDEQAIRFWEIDRRPVC